MVDGLGDGLGEQFVFGVEGGVGVVVQPGVGDQRLQRPQDTPARRPPRRQVRELPPPQRFHGSAIAVVGQPVQEIRCDARKIGREQEAVGAASRVDRVDDLDIVVDRFEQCGEPLTQLVDVGVGPGIGFEALVRNDVGDRTESTAGERELADLEEQQRERATRVVATGISRTATRKLSTWSAISAANSA